MAVTPQRNFKLSNAEMANLDMIAEAWAGRSPTGRLTRTDVIRLMIRDTMARIAPAAAKKSRKKIQESLS